MINKTLLAFAIGSCSFLASAHSIQLGQTAPEVSVSDYGEVVLNGEDTAFQPWQSQQLMGKVRVIQAIAGRSSAKEMNAPLMQAITAEKFDSERYQTTTIINQDDAIWGTGSFVKSSAQDSKKEFPWSSIVLDENGVVAKSWQLADESSAIIVQDKTGKVLFVKEGALTDAEVKQVLQLIKANI